MGLISLTPEVIASGIVGIVLASAVLRSFFRGWIEAKAQAQSTGNNAAMVNAVAIGFERDQRELMVQYLGRIAVAIERQSEAQVRMSDAQQRDMAAGIDELLERSPRKR